MEYPRIDKVRMTIYSKILMTILFHLNEKCRVKSLLDMYIRVEKLFVYFKFFHVIIL